MDTLGPKGPAPKKLDRRHVLKIITIGGVATAVLMPGRWMKPLAEAVITPAHAQASIPGVPGTTTTSTTLIIL